MYQNQQVHTPSIFTHRFEVEQRVVERMVERVVYFTDLQDQHGTYTVRIKEIHYVNDIVQNKFLMYIDPVMICRLVTGMDEFLMSHIFVPGSTPGATLAIDMGNGMKFTFSEPHGNLFKITKSDIRAGVERCLGNITFTARSYRLLTYGLEGACRVWQKKVNSGKEGSSHSGGV